jgi:hypothetical protein
MSDSVEFSEEKLLNNEWMDLGTEASVTASDDFAPNVINDIGMKNVVRDGPAPRLDERVEVSRMSWEQGTVGQWERRDAERRFTHHKPKPNQINACETIRKAGMDIALTIVGLCPTSPERDRAIDAIDMAVMWANASIARYQ